MIGRTISHYKILEKLGQGGMGEVYKARDLTLDRLVALKFLPRATSHDESSRQRFLREARMVSLLDHQNICTFYEAGLTEDGVPFLAMAYYDGQNIRQRIAGRPLSLDEALNIACAVCEGLSKTHEKGVIHRDIKSDNILVTTEGVVKIMDFGLARSLTTTSLTAAGATVGTMSYMSPEQLRGEKVDKRTDLWSLGVMLYEMITGRLPFISDYEEALAYSIGNEEPEPVTALRSGVPLELENIVKKLLQKKPGDRYQHVEDVNVDLRGVLGSMPKRLSGGLRNRKRTLLWASGILFLFIIAGAYWLYEYSTRPRHSVVTVLEPVSRGNPQQPGKEYAVGEKKRESLNSESREKTAESPSVSAPSTQANQVRTSLGVSSPMIPPSEKLSSAGRIAVLPFDNISESKDDEYFSDGMTEEIISTLSRVGGLRVIARTSVVQYKNRKKTAAEIGRVLNVAGLLEGTVRKAGQRVRISVQMVNTQTEEQLWSETYDRELKDIFEIQREVAENVAKSLQVHLSGESNLALAGKTENLDAYTLYLQGRYHWNLRSPSDLLISIQYFEKAIAADPNYSLAYSGLADTYTLLGNFYLMPQKEAYPKAKEAASKALSLDPTLSQAHAARAFALLHRDWDWEGAEADLLNAVETNPSNAAAQSWYAYAHTIRGRFEEARAYSRRAEDLDPLSAVIKLDAAITLYFARRYDDAIKKINEALKIEPGFFVALIPLAGCYAQTSRIDEAVRVLRRARFMSGNHPVPTVALGYALARSGKKDEALKFVEEVKNRSGKNGVPMYWLALVHIALGDTAQALDWLEKAYNERDASMVFLKTDPILDPLRAEPRFVQLLAKMKFD